MGVSSLVDFYMLRIEALEKRVEYEKKKRIQVETFAIELCDPECPEEYKKVVLNEILSSDD